MRLQAHGGSRQLQGRCSIRRRRCSPRSRDTCSRGSAAKATGRQRLAGGRPSSAPSRVTLAPSACTCSRSQANRPRNSPRAISARAPAHRGAGSPTAARRSPRRARTRENSRTSRAPSGCPAGSPAHRSAGLIPRRCSMPAFHASGSSRTASSPRKQLLLKLIAQQDVQRIGQLVGIDADQAALHARQARDRYSPAPTPGR